MKIRRYIKQYDEENVMEMLKEEGDEWRCYHADEVSAKYKAALQNSITYVAYENDEICGYSRSLDDCGFYIYVCDLLVRKKYRGREIGRKLMECIYKDFPDRIVYVMSDADGYYVKLGYRREGSVFEVTKEE
ncbi:MAG TPA: GNAT family N-acetyltransferase [Clostridiales bacterium]|jgi:GNAT superfamily N-acetyltransferase|nr:GNAT family N-acetyltransferase [Clostridiales bacterium]HOL79699.1 GNAT family N-acetyltransferase [Clostridiales bacterium]HPU67680.1 GNAT family N-acetyltransferase [Clostridiales bacterium]HQD71952.1 GNAT family N-acetyltransferase [Clostridiales bacterium]HXK83530.1 GNAT family N-acetyltransferase [Clostridiales bacterium]